MSAEFSSRARALFAVIVFLAVSARAGVEDRGTASGVFLQLSRTARETALGGCGTGAVGAAAIGRNPSGMVERSDALASRNQAASGELSVDYAAGTYVLPNGRAVGASLLHVSGGNITQVDDGGQAVGGFTPRDIAGTLGGATRLGSFNVGVTVSFLQSKIIHSAQTFTSSAGAEWVSRARRARVGFYGTNLTGHLQYVDAYAPLPRALRLGARKDVGHVGVVVEGVSPSDDAPFLAGGLEFNLGRAPWLFALRAGFDGSRARAREGANGLAVGAGIAGGDWSLDYSWTPGGDIGDDHLLTLGIKFKTAARSGLKRFSASSSTRSTLR